MSLTLRTTFGCTEAVIDEDANLARFYQVASILSEELEVAFLQKEDDFDAIMWTFAFNHHQITLQYSIYNGIFMFPTCTADAKKRANNTVIELANVLEGKLMSADLKLKTA